MQLKNSEIDSYLKAPANYHPVLLIYGPDQGLVAERVSIIKKHFLDENADPFALVKLDSDEIAEEPGRLVDEATTIALFGDNRLIHLRLNGRKQIIKSIKGLIETNNHTSVTIIEADNLAKNNPIRNLIEKAKNAVAIPCYADDERSLQSMIQEYFHQNNLTADHATITYLMSLLGGNRKTSRNELEKLCLFAADRQRITLEDIEKLIGDTSATLIDETVDHILCGNVAKASGNIQKIKANGQSQIQIILNMQRHLAHLQVLSESHKEGADLQGLIAKSKPPIHFKRKTQLIQQIKIWSPQDINKAFEQLHHLTAESRKNNIIGETLIENMLFRLSAIAEQKRKKA